MKKRYRRLLEIHHPSRGGNAKEFDQIAKAYETLTNNEFRANWEKYGNLYGPTGTSLEITFESTYSLFLAATFGIALPKWIVSEKYGLWVLAFYGLIFIFILPVAVGWWWYRSMRYSADKVLIETTRIFCHFLQKTPNMEISSMHAQLFLLILFTHICDLGLLTVQSGAFEFWRRHNTEIIE